MHDNNGTEQAYSHVGSEIALLGMLVADPRGIHDVSHLVSPADFSNAFYKQIFAGIRHLVFTEGLFDAAILEEYLAKNNPDVPDSKWLPLLVALRGHVGSSEQMQQHAQIISDKAVRRRMANLPELLVMLSRDPDLTTEQILSRAEDMIYGLRGDRRFDTQTMQDIASAEFDNISHRYEHGIDSPRILTGFSDWDSLMWGFRSGKPNLLAARPGDGKSTLGLDVAENVSLDHRVLFFSIEMDESELAEKRLSAHSGVPIETITHTSKMTAVQYQNVLESLSKVSDNLIVDFNPEATTDYIASVARREHARSPLGLIVVDHFHRIKNDHRTGNTAENLSKQAKEISVLLNKLNSKKQPGPAGLILTQLNRLSEYTANQVPGLANLKGTGALEEEAYTVTFLHREKEEPTVTNLLVAKNRGGPTGKIALRFDLEYGRFTQLVKRFNYDKEMVF